MINPLSLTPLCVQVTDLIAARIEAGDLAPGDPIPSESRMQQEYGVSRGTARRAVQELVDRGLVITMPQRATYVSPRDL